MRKTVSRRVPAWGGAPPNSLRFTSAGRRREPPLQNKARERQSVKLIGRSSATHGWERAELRGRQRRVGGAAPSSLRRRGAARSARTRTEADPSNGSGLYLGLADGEDGAGSAAHDALGDTAGHRARA